MFNPFYAFIGYRYAYVKRKNHFISFISLTSMLGIALGVAVLITVLSVMNGFHREIKREMLSATPHVTVRAYKKDLSQSQYQPVSQFLMQQPEIEGVAPFVIGQGMLLAEGRVKGVLAQGIAPKQADSVYPLSENMLAGDLFSLKPKSYHVLLGKEIAHELGITVGDKITLLIPEAHVTLAGMIPRMKRFTVSGIFDAGYQYNALYVFMHLQDAQAVFQMRDSLTGLQVRLEDELQAKPYRLTLGHLIDEAYPKQAFFVQDWTMKYKGFFEAIKMEKRVMSVILFLIIMVAAFNLVSSLVMMVTDKQTDIAILRTMGASKSAVMGIFITQGVGTGLIGTVLGTVIGLLLAFNVTELVAWLERLFQVQFVSEQSYFITYVPSDVQLSDLLAIVLGSIILSILATLYPAKRAASIQPAEALRYE